MKVAINGFGRIGRMILRAGLDEKELDFVAINDLTDIENLAYLLKYDSVYGKLDKEVRVEGDKIIIDKHKIKVYSEKEPSKLPWRDLSIDVVVESSGVFRTKEKASLHLEAGAKKVVLSAPAKGEDYVKTIVVGVNDGKISKSDKILSNASCTTNCLAPLVYVLNKKFGIKSGFMTTVHAYTTSQNIVDGPNKDLRRGRAGGLNIVPTSTGATNAVGLVIPELQGKLEGLALRIPVVDGSLVDLSVKIKKKVSVREINDLFRKFANKELKGILKYSEEKLVSSDIIGDKHACIFDSEFTFVQDDLVRVIGWYDNEFGYCCQLIKLLKLL